MININKIPVILHIPHWSTHIPADCRREILLDDDSLQAEILRLTDLYTEIAADGEWAYAVIKAEVSRLVVDVERFRKDAEEEMAAVGMGAVYTHTEDGRVLRELSTKRKEELLRRYYDSHHLRLTKAVEAAIFLSGRCFILDVHSFPANPFSYEKNKSLDRPDVCIGTDDYHTPRKITSAAMDYYRVRGFGVRENDPFSGSLVPAKYYRKNQAVQSLMIEFNRSLLVEETTSNLKQSGKEILKGVSQLVESLTNEI